MSSNGTTNQLEAALQMMMLMYCGNHFLDRERNSQDIGLWGDEYVASVPYGVLLHCASNCDLLLNNRLQHQERQQQGDQDNCKMMDDVLIVDSNVLSRNASDLSTMTEVRLDMRLCIHYSMHVYSPVAWLACLPITVSVHRMTLVTLPQTLRET